MPVRVGLILPPQLLESARAAQLANRQRLQSREAQERLGGRAQQQAQKARAARGLPAWPGAVPEFQRERRGRLWSRSQVLTRGVLTHGFYGIYEQTINIYTKRQILRIYSLDGRSFTEVADIYEDMAPLLVSMRHSASVSSVQTDRDMVLMVLPVSESSYLLVQVVARTITEIINTGVSSIPGGNGPALNEIFAQYGLRVFLLYAYMEQGWRIGFAYVLGQDTYDLQYRAWLVHSSGVKPLSVPAAFVQQAVSVTYLGGQDGLYYSGPVPPGEDVPIVQTLITAGNRLSFTKAPQAFVAASYGAVQVPPINSVAPGSTGGYSYTYASNAELFNDYEEVTIPNELAAVAANPPYGDGFHFLHRFTITPPNNQALPRAPIAYLQDLGFTTADLTP